MQGDGKFVTTLKGTAKGRVIEFENIMLEHFTTYHSVKIL